MDDCISSLFFFLQGICDWSCFFWLAFQGSKDIQSHGSVTNQRREGQEPLNLGTGVNCAKIPRYRIEMLIASKTIRSPIIHKKHLRTWKMNSLCSLEHGLLLSVCSPPNHLNIPRRNFPADYKLYDTCHI